MATVDGRHDGGSRRRRVVVTGIGIIVPGACDAEEFWRSSATGASRLGHEPLLEHLGLDSRSVAAIEGFDLARHHRGPDFEDLSGLSRFVQLTVTAGLLAGTDAGLPEAPEDGDRAGVVTSSAIGGTPEFQRAYEEGSGDGTRPLDPFPPGHRFYDSVFLNHPPAWLARRFGLRGPATTLTTGCTAGLDTLGLAFDQIREGELDVVLACSGEAPLSGLAYATLGAIRSLSTADGPPERASRPFDAGRAGFVLGEGAAALVLEDLEHACARGAVPYAEVLGFSSANNAWHMSDLAGDGASMATVITAALDDAGVDADEIDYVNAHGSSTPQNDVFETQALRTALGARHARSVPVSSSKSMIGHSLASASLVGTVTAIGAMRHGVVPPTAGYRTPDPACDLDYVPNHARLHDTRTALVSASGFGGIHSCAVLRRTGRPDTDGWARARPRPDDRPAAPGGPAIVGGRVGGPEPVTLFLHGFGGLAEHWTPLLAHVDERIRVVAVDLPGHGGNLLPTGSATAEVVRQIVETVDTVGGPGAIQVVGHSLGGLLALHLAAALPGRVRRVAVLGTAPRPHLHPPFLERLVDGTADDDLLAAALQDGGSTGAGRARHLVVSGLRALRDPGADVWGLADAPVPAGPDVPVLVVAGERDRVVSPRRCRQLADALPRSTCTVMPGADHYVHLERPDAVWEVLRAFLGAEGTGTDAGR